MSRWPILLLLAACARSTPPAPAVPASHPTPRPQTAAPPAPVEDESSFGVSAAEHAEVLLEADSVAMRDDCSGFVCAIYQGIDVPLDGNTQSLFAQAKAFGTVHHDTPVPGDLVFFDNTYDRNKNGRRDDELTHVGVVLDVFDDGTVKVAHRSNSKGRTLLYLNLDRPDEHSDEGGRVLNDFLRARRRSDPRNLPVLAGQLFRAYAHVDERWLVSG